MYFPFSNLEEFVIVVAIVLFFAYHLFIFKPNSVGIITVLIKVSLCKFYGKNGTPWGILAGRPNRDG